MNTYTILYNIEKPGTTALFGREWTVEAQSEQQAVDKLRDKPQPEGHTVYEVEAVIKEEA